MDKVDTIADSLGAPMAMPMSFDLIRSHVDDVVRVRYILPDKEDWPACWPLTSAAFERARPAATMISAALQETEMKLEIEVTARLPEK